MTREDMVGRIIAHAFQNELEKIAGLPRAVREGGGGVVGAAMRRMNEAGRASGAQGPLVLRREPMSYRKRELFRVARDAMQASGQDRLADRVSRLGEARFRDRLNPHWGRSALGVLKRSLQGK